MPVAYPGREVNLGITITDQPVRTLPDVLSSFDNIPLIGDFIPVNSHPNLISSDSYNPYTADNIIDLGKNAARKRHFQGIVRTQDGKNIIIAGGDHHIDKAQIFVCRVASKSSSKRNEIGIGAVESNAKHGHLEDIFVTEKTRYWHNGGITSFGNILVLPLESDGFLPKQDHTTEDSIIKFLDISNPSSPLDLNIDIRRPGTKSGSACMVRLPKGKYICAVWTDSDPNKKKRIDFYLSNSNKLKDGFDPTVVSYFYSEKFNNKAKYQTIQLFLQKDKNNKYKLFMTGTHNSYSWSPVPPSKGHNRARLYEVAFEMSLEKSDFKISLPVLIMRRGTHDKVFKGGGKRYNFNAAAGFYITPEKTLALYATHHRTYHFGQIISVTEFYPVFQTKVITKLKDSLIELYQDKNFKGSCLRIRGYNQTKLSDYIKVKAEDLIFNNKISSIRYQIPAGSNYKLYEFTDFMGRAVELKGNGKLIEIKNIHLNRKKTTPLYTIPAKMGNTISSSKFE